MKLTLQESCSNDYLPSSHTCFFALDLPNYTEESVMREKLLYAIEFCKAIDNDVRAADGLLGAISREEAAMEEETQTKTGDTASKGHEQARTMMQPFVLHSSEHKMKITEMRERVWCFPVDVPRFVCFESDIAFARHLLSLLPNVPRAGDPCMIEFKPGQIVSCASSGSHGNALGLNETATVIVDGKEHELIVFCHSHLYTWFCAERVDMTHADMTNDVVRELTATQPLLTANSVEVCPGRFTLTDAVAVSAFPISSGKHAFEFVLYDGANCCDILSCGLVADKTRFDNDMEQRTSLNWGQPSLFRGEAGGVTLNLEERTADFHSFSTVRSCRSCSQGQSAYYEIEILDDELENPQFGFCSPGFESAQTYTGIGVGDDQNSWGVDGMRSRKWRTGADGQDIVEKYMCRWKCEDVLGFAVDLVERKIFVSVNGSYEWPNGLAFELEESAMQGGSIFAAFTASCGKVRYNMGDTPFKYSPPTTWLLGFNGYWSPITNLLRTPRAWSFVSSNNGHSTVTFPRIDDAGTVIFESVETTPSSRKRTRTKEGYKAVVETIQAAISRGAPTYNEGDHRGCAEEYIKCCENILKIEGGLDEDTHRAVRNTLSQQSLLSSVQSDTERAWDLRHTLDHMLADDGELAQMGLLLRDNEHVDSQPAILSVLGVAIDFAERTVSFFLVRIHFCKDTHVSRILYKNASSGRVCE